MKNIFQKLCSIIVSLTILGFCYSAPAATVTVDKATPGWTGTLTFHTDQDANLGTTPISFDLSNGVKVSSIWGINGNPSFTQSGSTVTLKANLWWPADQGYIVKAGTQTTISFSASSDIYSISNVKLAGTTISEGSVILSQASVSSAIPSGAIVKLTSQADKTKIYTLNFVNGQSSKVPYGTYDVSGSVVVNSQTVALGVTPTVATINSATPLTIALTYTNNIKNVTFSYTQPNPESFSGLNIVVKDFNDSSSNTVNIPWSVTTKQLTIVSGHAYQFTATNVTTNQFVYSFSFTPASITAGTASDYAVNITYARTPIPAANVYVAVSGLPAGAATSLTFTPADQLNQTVVVPNVINGKNSLPYQINIGNYTMSAAAVTIGSTLYSALSQGVKVNQGDNTYTLGFTASTQSVTVKGWPTYIAMGGVTRGEYSDASTFANRPLDSIFKYAGDGGNGDPGRIVYPVATTNTMTQADLLTTSFGKKVMPVMVVYTSEMSGGTSFKDFDDSANVLTMHFINLMIESGVMQSYKTASNTYPASIVLNPDLFGMVQQQKMWNTAGTGALNATTINVNKAVQKANWFMTTKQDWSLTLNSGKTITAFQKTPVEFITLIRNGTYKADGVYTAWDIKTQWEAASVAILAKVPATLTASLPTFENNFKGWIQATNWTVKTFGPDISFGWQSNVWSISSSNWVHQDLSAQQVADNYSAPVADLWNALGVYNGTYRPDFVVFDKYERDAASEVGIGYLWNQRDIANYMNFTKSISDKLGNYPVMLWQIPGGHMQLASGDVDPRENHGSTEPDYFFGDANLKPDLSNVKSYFLNLAMPLSPYGTTSVKTYLTQNNQDWTKGHMDVAKDSRVFSILWGGGDTTSIGKVGADDNGWLANKVIEYYKNPTYLGPQTPVELAAKDDTILTDMNQTVNISVLSNDLGNGLKIVSASMPSHGTTTVTGSQISYIPANGFVGTDKFSYIVSDSTLKQATAFVNITVNAIAAPVATADTAQTTFNTAVTIDVLANDTGSSVTLSSVGIPSTGTAVISNGKIVYTPASGFTGTALFTYTIADSVAQKATGNISITVSSAASTYSAWDAGKVYNTGDIVSYNGHNYKAKWWTQGENPTTTGQWGVWEDLGTSTPPVTVEDKTSPTVTFTSHTDGQIIKLRSLSAINLAISATDAGGVTSSSIIVGGITYNGTSASWTPSAFGTYKLTAFAKDTSGNSTSINITIAVFQDTTIPPVTGKKQIIGYITQWDAWKGTSYGLPAQGVFNHLNVDYTKYTILNFSFFGVAKDGSLHSADLRNKAMSANNPAADQEPAMLINDDLYGSWDEFILFGDVKYNYNTIPATIEKVAGGAPGLLELGKQNNVKVMASIGGWSMSKHFSAMAANASLKANFIRDVNKLMDMGFDGIDIDWEYPGAAGMNFTGVPADFQNFTNLMKDIRGAIGYDKLLTAAFSASPNNLAGFNFAELDQYMSYYNMMTYDMEGGWSSNAGHNSSLYNDSGFSWEQTFKYLLSRGAKAEKINMGVGFYGRGVKTATTGALGAATGKSSMNLYPDGTVMSASDTTNWPLFDGVPNYAYLKNNSKGWTKVWDSKAKVPYMVKGNYFLSYDDPQSIKEKADYVVLNGAGGVIVWQVFGDMEFSGAVTVAPGGKLPKATTVKTELLDALYSNMNK